MENERHSNVPLRKINGVFEMPNRNVFDHKNEILDLLLLEIACGRPFVTLINSANANDLADTSAIAQLNAIV